METPDIQDLSIKDKKLEVIFCQVCQAPIEYCEYSTTFPECKLWLAQNHPEEFKKLHGDLPENIEPGDTPAPKKGKAKASKPAKIVISVIERTKRKRITQVRGLDKFGTFINRC